MDASLMNQHDRQRLCERCGYPRTGLPADARCPECGEPPSPVDLRSSRLVPFVPLLPGAARDRAEQRWLATLAAGLVLLIVCSFYALQVALVMSLGGLVVATINAAITSLPAPFPPRRPALCPAASCCWRSGP
jgi:hypothetical protein